MVTCGDDATEVKFKDGRVCAQDSDKQAAPAMALGPVEDGGEPVGAGIEGAWRWTVSGNE